MKQSDTQAFRTAEITANLARLGVRRPVAQRAKDHAQMMRAVVYARYSSEAQRESSIEDQQARCHRYAEVNDMNIVERYSDAAGKGWNPERLQYQAMLAAAARGEFDVLLLDDLSRLTRDAGEQSRILRRLQLLGIRVISVADGWDSSMPGSKAMAGFKGIMNEQYLDQLAECTRRGQKGRVDLGLSAGGSVYGYATEQVMDANGKVVGARRVILEQEAEVVRSIYAMYAAGQSPAKIAEDLNARGIKGPRGGSWSRNAIYGDQRDLSGILNNPLYRGELVWNRSTFVRDPDAGKRVKVRNDPSTWVLKPVPELRILSEELVGAVLARQALVAERGDAIRAGIGAAARSGADGKYWLTGLLKCSTCGGPISTVGPNLFGCSVRHNRGNTACNNDVKFRRAVAEERILDTVQSQLFTPSAVTRFIEHLSAELAQQTKSGASALAKLQKALKDTESGIEQCVDFIMKGNSSPAVEARLAALERQQSEMRASLRETEAASKLTAADLDELKAAGLAALGELPDLLANSAAETRDVLARLLGAATVVTPTEDKTALEIKMAGHMTGLLSIPAVKQRKTAKLVNVVAGAGFEPTTLVMSPKVATGLNRLRVVSRAHT